MAKKMIGCYVIKYAIAGIQFNYKVNYYKLKHFVEEKTNKNDKYLVKY